MTFNFIDGTTTTTSSEQTIADINIEAQFAFWLFLHNMTSAESMRIRIYVDDAAIGTDRLYIDETLSGVQAESAFYVAPVLATGFKITIQRTAGSDIDVTWQRIEVT